MNRSLVFLFLAAIGIHIGGCSRNMTYNEHTLNHCASLNDETAESIIDQLVADRSLYIDLATSGGGGAAELAYDSFEEYYQIRQQEFSKVLGSPSWEGSWHDPAYPDWALGERISVWDHESGKIYLRINWEDDTMPVVVSIGTTESKGGFNNVGESPYRFLREASANGNN